MTGTIDNRRNEISKTVDAARVALDDLIAESCDDQPDEAELHQALDWLEEHTKALRGQIVQLVEEANADQGDLLRE